ncbi:MAG: hypothetical protein IJ355_01635 [Prevotella sp.]|nr:hypothetical protein [Prevotella sp.]
MKKILIVLLSVLFSILGIKAQNLPQKRPVYCNVMGYNFWGFGKVKVQLDMGRKTDIKGFDALYGEDGKKLKFNTMMQVLNYMGERGWRVVNTYYITESSKQNVIHYLLEKWISSEDEITEGLILKEENSKPYKPGEGGDDMY